MAQTSTRRTMPIANSSTEQIDRAEKLPPKQLRTTNGSANPRHSKKLSLSFPVLAPSSQSIPPSGTDVATGQGTVFPANVLMALDSPRIAPVTSIGSSNTQSPSPAVESTDFLTLLAAQERKVLELREELKRAETELVSLKKQWALHEATKKRTEGSKSHALQMQTISPGGAWDGLPKHKSTLERRRTLAERGTAAGGGRHPQKKSQQRVFSGSRHARTLSLLATPSATSPVSKPLIRSSLDETATSLDRDAGQTNQGSETSISSTLMRTPTLPELSEQLGFGKTYKELANHRRSMAQVPPSAEILVRQGRQMAEGIKEGLWTFFEDIRQATVGEEGINGNTVIGVGPIRQSPQGATQKGKKSGVGEKGKKTSLKSATRVTPSASGNITTPMPHNNAAGSKERSFWNEFGLDTPHRQSNSTASSRPRGEVTSSLTTTDGTQPPLMTETEDPLIDLADNDEDDAWEAWESPTPTSITTPNPPQPLTRVAVSQTTTPSAPSTSTPKSSNSSTSASLPWPELKRLTPSKLTRTVSDLMGEWAATAAEIPQQRQEQEAGHVTRTETETGISETAAATDGLGIQLLASGVGGRTPQRNENGQTENQDGHILASTLM